MMDFEGRPKEGEKLQPDGLDWLSYLAARTKSYCEISEVLLSPLFTELENCA